MLTRLRTHGPVGLAVAFMIVSAFNVIRTTNQVPSDVPLYEEPIEFQPQDDLLSMAEQHGDFVRTRHLFYLQLNEVVDGRPVITSRNTFLDPGQTLGLARSELLIHAYNPEVGDDVGAALLGLPAYRGTLAHHRKGRIPYVIVRTTSHRSDSRFRTMLHEGTLIVVDEAMLDELVEREAW